MAELPRLDVMLGIVGGTGVLGGAIVQALLRQRTVEPRQLWLANRSGRQPPVAERTELTVTTTRHLPRHRRPRHPPALSHQRRDPQRFATHAGRACRGDDR